MRKKDIIIVLAIAILVSFFLSPFASKRPDGLERVAKDKGFLARVEGKPPVMAPLPDYTFPGIRKGKAATAVAGALGTLAAFGLGLGLALSIKKRARAGSGDPDVPDHGGPTSGPDSR